MKWIGNGTLLIGSKTIGYGDEVPKGALDTATFNRFVKDGLVGDIPERIDPEALVTEHITALEKENEGLKKQVATLEKQVTALGKAKK